MRPISLILLMISLVFPISKLCASFLKIVIRGAALWMYCGQLQHTHKRKLKRAQLNQIHTPYSQQRGLDRPGLACGVAHQESGKRWALHCTTSKFRSGMRGGPFGPFGPFRPFGPFGPLEAFWPEPRSLAAKGQQGRLNKSSRPVPI